MLTINQTFLRHLNASIIFLPSYVFEISEEIDLSDSIAVVF